MIKFDGNPTPRWEENEEFGDTPELFFSEDVAEITFGTRRINRFQRHDRVYLPRALIMLWNIDKNNRTVYIRNNIMYTTQQENTVEKKITVTQKAIYLNLPALLAACHKRATHIKFVGDDKQCKMEFLCAKRPDLKYRNPEEFNSLFHGNKNT